MGNWSYLSRTQFKLNLSDTATTDDAIYRLVLETVSEQIDREMRRTFRSYVATRTYSPGYSDRLDVDDLLSVTTLKTDPDDDYDYDDTWVATDYFLLPQNAVADRNPYTRIMTKPNGTQSFRLAQESVQIIGKWGYYEELELMSATAAEAMDTTETGYDVSDGTAFGVLDTILADSEQMYVTAIATNTLTVVRGVNGTTAASHLTGIALSRYKYPAPVVEACGIQAGRYFLRKNAPFGTVGSPDIGYIRLQSELDPDVKLLLQPYRRYKMRTV